MMPHFFASQDEWWVWLERHHATENEMLVGFRKAATGLPTMTWNQSVDVALCFGWIDGVRRGIDSANYCIRFTPRKASSIWSAKNIRRISELTEEGWMQPAGLAAFERRSETRSSVYSFEQMHVEFNRDQTRTFQANKPAWQYFASRPASYRRPATWWVVNAKREETKARRLASLIDHSANRRDLPHLTRKHVS